MTTPKDIPIIAFTSGKGGCGKTTIAVNFAYSTFKARKGNKVLVIDFDISNRGSTGVFSRWTKDIDQSLTLTRILNNEHHAFKEKIIDIEGGYYFVPASCSLESPWKEPSTYNLNDFVVDLRGKLLEVANWLGVDCIVLDCFCGIDLLTTAGSSSADHAIIINEPDIVTFTGSLSLKLHLTRSFEHLEKKPEVHFVINRVRSHQKVSDLNTLYKQNLLQEVNNAVLTYIPYNNKIFTNFGSYPFFVELLPKSLFTQKIQQIGYVLFIDSHPKLIAPKVQRWGERKFKGIYLKSIDKSAVDTEYLIVKLISVPILIGLLAMFSIFSAKLFKFTPQMAWGFVIVITILALSIYFMRMLTTALTMARLHFTLANFLYRLGLKSRFKEARVKEMAKTILPFLSGVFITVTFVLLVYLGIYFGTGAFNKIFTIQQDVNQYDGKSYLFEYLDIANQPGNIVRNEYYLKLSSERHPFFRFVKDSISDLDSKSKLVAEGFVKTALELPLRRLDLSNSSVVNVDFDSYSDLMINPYFRHAKDFSDRVNFENTIFNYCNMPFGFLNSSISSGVYNYCYFNSHSENYYDIEDKYIHSELKSSFGLNAHSADSGRYSNVTINGLVVDGVFFYASSFDNVTINLNSNNYIALWDCKLDDLKVNLISSNNNTGPAYVFVPPKDTGNIKLGPNIEVIALSNFKNQLYEVVYDKYDKIDKKTELFRSINEFEDLLPTVSDRRRSLKNLSELYMMTYDTLFYSRIERLLDDLDKALSDSKSGDNPNLVYVPDDEGIYYMLRSSYAILRNNQEARDSFFNKYRDWIYSDAKLEAERKLGLWDFGTWNEQMLLNADVLTDNQIELFNLLQNMAFSSISESKSIQEYHVYTGARKDMNYNEKIEQITNIYYEQKRISNLRKKGF